MAEQDARRAEQQAIRVVQSRVFNLLDAVSQAKTDLEGTVQVALNTFLHSINGSRW